MAAETTEERQAWLRRAETECWSVAELRAAIAQAKRLKGARQAESDGEKDGPQSVPTPSDHAPSPSPQTPPEPGPAAEPVNLEPMWSDDDAPAAQDLAPKPNVDVVPPIAPGEPAPPPAAIMVEMESGINHATGPKSGKQILEIAASVRRRLGDDPDVLELCDWIEAHAVPHDVGQEVRQTGRLEAHTNERQ